MGFAFFGAQAVLLAAFVLLGLQVKERPSNGDSPGRIPLLRLAILSMGVVFIAYSGIEVTATATPLYLAAGFVFLGAFLWIDGRNPTNRLLPKRPFDPRTALGAALLMVLTMNIATMGLTTYGPLLMTSIHSTSALTAGYVVAAVAIGWTVAAIIVSGAPERYDPVLIAVGMLLVAVSLVGLIYAVPNGPIWLIAIFATMEGVGYGTAWTFIIRRSRSLTPTDDLERLSGGLPTVSRLGIALGASVSGILANAAGFADAPTADQLDNVAFILFAGTLPIALISLVAMVRFVTVRPSPQ